MKGITCFERDTEKAEVGVKQGKTKADVLPTVTDEVRRRVSPRKRGLLVLVDGSVYRGLGFGACKKAYGEVVFNTGMMGYPESITDPSYRGQILVQTYPLIGNYGVCPLHFESDGPKIEGYVVHEACFAPSHWASLLSLEEWFEREGVPGVYGVDTRALTKKLRVYGVMKGLIYVYEGEDPDVNELVEEAREAPDIGELDLVKLVTTDRVLTYHPGVKPRGRVVLIDCGVKWNIIRSLLGRGLLVIRVPAQTEFKEIMELKPDGVLISNGPGDPKKAWYVVETARRLIDEEIPVMGICLGHQIISLAIGAETYKLKFGHRGQNHPCVELKTGRCYITSQNHGYVVDPDTLEKDEAYVTFVNGNDKTVEGVALRSRPVFGVQFHPEASPGPYDTGFLFDRFVEMVVNRGGRAA